MVQYTVCTVAKGAACCGAETSCTVRWVGRRTSNTHYNRFHPPPSFPFLLQWRSESSYCREIQNVLLCTVRFIIETLTVFPFLLQNERGVGFRSKGEWLQSHWMMGCRYPSVDELISSRFALGVNSWISGSQRRQPERLLHPEMTSLIASDIHLMLYIFVSV